MKSINELNRKASEYSRKIEDLKSAGASLSDLNYWRRKLNIVFGQIRSQEEKGECA